MGRRDFVDLLRRIAQKHSLEMRSMSHDWIVQFVEPRSGKQSHIMGYIFDINPAAGVEICKEKSATALVLATHDVPCVPHEVFLTPSRELSADYVPTSGNWKRIEEYAQKYKHQLVIKPLKGTGGLGVVRTKNQRDVEAAVQEIFQTEYGLCLSPFKVITEEYRCIVVDGESRIVYRKVRPYVEGDGSSSVGVLAGRVFATADSIRQRRAAERALGTLTQEEIRRVPAAGEQVVLEWKHNLGQGAVSELVRDGERKQQLALLAMRAQSAVGLRFCSVDVVEVEGEGLMVMEINCGVMMDNFLTQIDAEIKQLAEGAYEDAVLRHLGISA
eukprot:Hpha_TRINITY_DN33753_c0_g1::TRINITY_DN33753_c0_g1_i1::g.25031::m.25031